MEFRNELEALDHVTTFAKEGACSVVDDMGQYEDFEPFLVVADPEKESHVVMTSEFDHAGVDTLEGLHDGLQAVLRSMNAYAAAYVGPAWILSIPAEDEFTMRRARKIGLSKMDGAVETILVSASTERAHSTSRSALLRREDGIRLGEWHEELHPRPEGLFLETVAKGIKAAAKYRKKRTKR